MNVASSLVRLLVESHLHIDGQVLGWICAFTTYAFMMARHATIHQVADAWLPAPCAVVSYMVIHCLFHFLNAVVTAHPRLTSFQKKTALCCEMVEKFVAKLRRSRAVKEMSGFELIWIFSLLKCTMFELYLFFFWKHATLDYTSQIETQLALPHVKLLFFFFYFFVCEQTRSP